MWLSITGHGRADPHADTGGVRRRRRGGGGLVGWVGWNARVFIADAVADPLAGVTAAAAVVQLLESPGRWMADVALSRVAAQPPWRRRPMLRAQRPTLDAAGRGLAPIPVARCRSAATPTAVLAEFGIDARRRRAVSVDARRSARTLVATTTARGSTR